MIDIIVNHPISAMISVAFTSFIAGALTFFVAIMASSEEE